MAIDRSPSAFPSSPEGKREEHLGMTLREWYAGQALIGILARSRDPDMLGTTPQDRVRIAAEAHAIADAMLTVRSSS